MPRRLVSILTLILATLVLALRVREINRPAPSVSLAPRTLHLLYLDSLRQELVSFAEQYGRPVFRYDTTSPVTGHGRVQLARLRNALFDPRVEYGFGDDGFVLDWRSDPKPRISHGFAAFGAPHPPTTTRPLGIANAWPESAAEYARIRRIFVPPHADAYATIALGQTQ